MFLGGNALVSAKGQFCTCFPVKIEPINNTSTGWPSFTIGRAWRRGTSIAIKWAMQGRDDSQEILIEFDENTNANEQAERVIEKTDGPSQRKGADVRASDVRPTQITSIVGGRIVGPQLPKAIAALNQELKSPPKRVLYRKRPHLRPVKRPVPIRFQADQSLGRRPVVKMIRTRVHKGVRTVERIQLFFMRMYNHYYFLPVRQKRNVFITSLTFLLFLSGLWTGFAVFKFNEAKRMAEATGGRAVPVRIYKAKPAKSVAKLSKKQSAQRAPSSKNPASKPRIGRRAAR